MKKLSSIIAVLLLSSGVTFAQQSNVSEVIETGKTQKATVDQQGILNKSVVEQTFTDQTNGFNTATVTQINSNTKTKTDSYVKQTGITNDATVEQTSTTQASGDGTLKATVIQSGNLNDAFQTQGPNDYQGNSTAEINQGGSENYAFQLQVRHGNFASINQAGSNNIARQGQDAKLLPYNPGSDNKAYIIQGSNSNRADQTQEGWGNYVKIEQLGGNENTATQLQNNYSFSSIATIFQSGYENNAAQTQQGYLNTATIDQTSPENHATQTQNSTEKDRSLNNLQPYNEAHIYQSGRDENTAIQDQDIVLGGSIVKNYAYINQTGDLNFADQDQDGGNNSSEIWQTGTENHADVTQTTTSGLSGQNVSTINQTQSGESVLGSYHDVVVTQSDIVKL